MDQRLFYAVFLLGMCTWSHGKENEPVLAICPGTCVAHETECNTTLDGTHCGHDAKCCLERGDLSGTRFDFSTLPTNLPDWASETDGPLSDERSFDLDEIADTENLGDFYLDSAPHSAFSTVPITNCPGACIPKKHVSLCQWIIGLSEICAADKACCVTREAALKLQEDYNLDPSVIIQQNVRASSKCPGKCIPPSLAIFCDKVMSNFNCPGDHKCCNRQLTTTDIPEPVECTGQCLPRQSTYFCNPPLQLVAETNCKESTVCCMQVEENTSEDERASSEAVDETGELASDETGQLYSASDDGEYKPLLKITPEEILNSDFAYVTDVDTESGPTSIYRDGTGSLYQLSIIPQEQEPIMAFTVAPEAEPDSINSVGEDSEKPTVSMPDDSDDMEENMKDVALFEDGEDVPSKDTIPPGERTMIRPECPGSCISAFLKFTCNRNTAIYDGFSCPNRLVCCADLMSIEEHEQYLKTLSPYFKAAESVSPQNQECGIAGFEDHTFGMPVTAEKWCWQAAVINEQNQYVCGAAIIDNSWALTPAHCVTGSLRQEQSVFVRVGVTDLTSAADNAAGQTRMAKSVYVHPNHNSMSLDNDIALMKLEYPLELTKNTCVVCLPKSEEMRENEVCTVTGYGFLDMAGTLSLKLEEAQVPIVDDIDCIANVTDALSSVFILPSSSFCAGGHGNMESCQGDAGGLLVCQRDGIYELSGMVSWSLGCKRDDVPSIYVKISASMEWISQIIVASTFLKALS